MRKKCNCDICLCITHIGYYHTNSGYEVEDINTRRREINFIPLWKWLLSPIFQQPSP